MQSGLSPPRRRDLFDGVRVIWRATLAEAEVATPAPADAVLITPFRQQPPNALASGLTRLRPCAPRLLLHCAGETAMLRAAVAARCDGVVLAHCAGGAALQQASARLAVLEAEGGRPAGTTALVAEVGAVGLLALPSLAGSTDRLAALTWDPAALAATSGGVAAAFAAGSGGAALRPWLVMAAAAANVPAYDAAQPGTVAAVAAQLRDARALGFAGMVTDAAHQCTALAAALRGGTLSG